MKRYYKFLAPVLLLMALTVSWASQAQRLGDYSFQTGNDASKWVELTSTTNLITSNGDSYASTLQNIGFTFPFAGQNYTQFSVNTDGNLRLGSTVTGVGNYSTPFSSSNANTNNPKINAMGCDGYKTDSGYVHAELVINDDGDSMLVVEFAMSTYNSTSRNALLRWQVQLHTNGVIEIVYYSQPPAILPAVTRQCGLCLNATDGYFINENHQPLYFTSGTSQTIPTGNWPDANRYYTFTPGTCYAPGTPVASNITPYGFTINWAASTTADGYVVRLNNEEPIYVSLEDSTTYTFSDIIPDSNYTAYVAALCSGDDTSAWRLVNVHTLPSCAVVTNLAATTTTAAALLSWTPSVSDPECQGMVEYKLSDDTTNAWVSLGTTMGNTYVISGLNPATGYTARVAALCANGDTSNWSTVSFTTGSFPCVEFDTTMTTFDTIGTGTSTSSYFPCYSLYNYSYSQQIYTAEEVGGAGSIMSLSIYPTSVPTPQRNVELYLAHTNDATASTFLNPADLTLVYSGTITLTADEWFTFEFTAPFNYNGADNLLVIFRDMTGSWSSSNSFQGTTGTSGCSRYAYNDNAPYPVGNPGVTGTASNFRNNIVLKKGSCSQQGTCASPSAVVSNVTATTVTVEWIPGATETSWDLYQRAEGAVDFTYVTTATSTTYEFVDLTPATNYDFRVAVLCGTDTFYSDVNAFTNCVPITRLREDFNSYSTGSSADFNICWTKGREGTSTNYPYVNTISDEKAMYFYSYYSTTNYKDWLITPEFTDSLNTLILDFDMYRSSTTNYYTSKVIIGAIRNTGDITTMDSITEVWINNPSAAGVWQHHTISLENYHGNGNHIVFYAPAVAPWTGLSSTYTYNVFYLDNVMIQSVNGCPMPTRLHSREITSTTAEVAWDNNESVLMANVKWGTTNSLAAATDSATVVADNSLALTGLTPATTYYCWVTFVCEEDEGFEVSTSFTTAPNCGPVSNFRATGVGLTNAAFSWNANEISPATSYSFSWKVDTLDTWNTASTVNTFYIVEGLNENTGYNVQVMPICSDDSATVSSLHINTNEYGTFGADEGTYYLPTYPYYNYSISEQLWLDEELSIYGNTINGIYFNAGSDIEGRHMQIWVANTQLNDLSEASFVPSTSMTLVFDSLVDIEEGWNEFHFSTPFVRTAGSNLAVMVHDTNDYESFDGWVTSSSPVTSLYGYRDASDFSTTDLSELNAVSARAQMRLNASLAPAPSCLAPVVAVADVTSSSVTVAWVAGLNETSWTVSYRAASDTAWTVLAASTADTFATATGLDAATNYVFRVGAICGGNVMNAAVSVTTGCGDFTVPYREDFNALSTNNDVVNPCWTMGTTGTGSTPYTVNITNEGMMVLMPRGSYIIFPTMDEALNNLQLRMRYLAADTSIFSVVGICSYPGDIFTFTPIDTIWCETAGAGTWVTIPFEEYEGDGQIAIYSWYNQSYIDDVNIEIAPLCKPATALTLDATTTTSATISWTEGLNGTSYIVDYWDVNADTVVTSVSASGTSATLTGLQHSTTYKAVVRTVCSVQNDTSLATNALTFTTECAPVSLPYVQNFDHCNTPALTYTGVIPNCWSNVMLASGTYATGNYVTQIYSGSSYAHSGNYSLRMAGTAVVLLPEMPTSVDSLQVKFHDYNTSYSYYGLILGVCDSNTTGYEASFVPVDTLLATQAHTNFVSYALASYTGTGRYIALKNFYNSSSYTYDYSYHYIDDVEISYLPTCMPVTNLRAASTAPGSVDLTWNDLRPATEWQVAYSTHAMSDPLTGTVTTATTNPFTISGLADSVYYFYVRTICGAGDTAEWSSAFTIRPGSWNMRPNQTDTISLCGGTIYDDGGATGNYSSSQDSYIILMPEGNTIVEVSGTLTAENNWDYLHIYDGIGTSGTVLWEGSNGSFSGLASTTGPLTIYFESDASGNYAGFEIHVNCVSNACPISDIQLDSTVALSSNSLSVVWTGSSTQYEIEYGPAGFVRGNGTFDTVSTNSYVMTGLSAAANYDFYVRGYCLPDTSRWFYASLQTALCDNAAVVENWDTSMNAGTSSYSPVGYDYYNYSYVQTIIDASFLTSAGAGEINAMAFLPTNTTAGSYFNHIDVYLANVSDTSLATGFIHPDSAHTFVHVIADADFSFSTTDWQLHGFDTAFAWDGHSNVLVAVTREHGTYSSSHSAFSGHTHAAGKMRYANNDSNPYDINTATGGTASSATTMVGDIRLFSCGESTFCQAPENLTATDTTENSVTISWTGTADEYEVAYVEGTWVAPAVGTLATGTTHTFTGLTPETPYTIGVRAACSEESLSEWTTIAIVTPEHACMVPTNIVVSNVTLNSAVIDWTLGEEETAWELNVTGTNYDQTFTVEDKPYTLTGLNYGVTYTVKVRALCSETRHSEWSEPASFTTVSCEGVTGVVVNSVTANSAVVSWTAPAGATTFDIEYGQSGFSQGTGTTVSVTGTSTTLTGLTSETMYDVYVRTVCYGGSTSAWSDAVTFETSNDGIDDVAGAAISLYPNPASSTVTLIGIEGMATVTVVDMNGRETGKWTVSDGELTIDVTDMAQGAYFVRIVGEQVNAIRKLIVR